MPMAKSPFEPIAVKMLLLPLNFMSVPMLLMAAAPRPEEPPMTGFLTGPGIGDGASELPGAAAASKASKSAEKALASAFLAANAKGSTGVGAAELPKASIMAENELVTGGPVDAGALSIVPRSSRSSAEV